MPLRLLRQTNLASSAVVLPDELMAEIVSWLSVKHLIQLRCVNKFFQTLISDPYFVQMHLMKSARTPNLAHIWLDSWEDDDSHIVSQSIPPFNSLHNHPSYRLIDFVSVDRVVGSCNGLICLISSSYLSQDEWLCFWNPATRTKSENFRIFSDLYSLRQDFKFSFGYDILNETYKVVGFMAEIELGGNLKNVVKVFSLGDNSWRDIQCLPVIPLYWFDGCNNKDVYLNGTINWLSNCNHDFYLMGVIENYVILSLDLSTESYTQMMLPRGFDKGPKVQANIAVLMNFLCFCRDFERNHFVIWQMKDFGVQESWVQLFKISYQNFYSINGNLFDIQRLKLLPIHLSENGYTLILANIHKAPAFICDCRDDTIERIRITNMNQWLWAKDHIESLVPTR
ncbi:F-box/kelch-repeat protein At3g23880-like [Vicia villosa]|uniref:F-box/kelch-repeat protein At3g23880-like n=1 Tax=Vicia villosa TaxID=3911 RepID=UPI00273BA00D|nr:F-box/kelch-repeat protein At3g23880-like [Vicia villosa]